MRHPQNLLWVLAVVGAVGIPATVSAQDTGTYPKRSLRALATSSDLIVAGRIVRVMSVERKNELAEHSYNKDERYEVRVAWIEIDEVVRGKASKNQRVKLIYPAVARVPGEPIYEEEQQGVWFLRKSGRRGEYLADHPRRFQPLSEMDRIQVIVKTIKTNDGKSGKNSKKRKRPKK